MSSSSVNVNDLPQGWVQQFDEDSKQRFWVDTTSSPPRAIWVHPFEDEQFLNAHPVIRKRLQNENSTTLPMSDGRAREDNLTASHSLSRDPFSDTTVGAYDSPPRYRPPQDHHDFRAVGVSNALGDRAAGPSRGIGLSRRDEADSFYEQSSSAPQQDRGYSSRDRLYPEPYMSTSSRDREDRADRGSYYEPPRYLPPPAPLPSRRGHRSDRRHGFIGRIADAAHGRDDPSYHDSGRRPRQGLVSGLLGAALSHIK